MVEILNKGCYWIDGNVVFSEQLENPPCPKEAREKTITYSILREHEANCSETNTESNSHADSGGVGGSNIMRLRFDALISHDITYVGIIQTARASGMTEFPIPYAMTNCHNSLCAVGGTINEDDHAFGLSAAKKFGGIFVPPNLAVIHQYARECMAKCGGMILGSDSHTRYGAYGAMGIGEGGGELVKQLLRNTYDVQEPEVVLVYLDGKPRKGVGPQDVALELVAATFGEGIVKNKILEFCGPGLSALSSDFRIGIDVMTTETSCLSSIWETDEIIAAYYENIGRPEDYKKLTPQNGAFYDNVINIDLGKVECMIALPFHPSKACTIHALQQSPEVILRKAEENCNAQLNGTVTLDLRRNIQNGQVICDQGVIVGCSGGMFENIMEATAILRDGSIGNGYFDLSVYPSSAPISLAITENGASADLMKAGCVLKPAFCGPCFGAGDTPADNTLSIRHATRNFANRDGSKPSDGQISAVALMDARSIAATARNGGVLTAATDIEYDYCQTDVSYVYNNTIYEKRVYNGFGNPQPETALRFGPNIKDWPKMSPLDENLLVQLCAVIHDEVTTTDELIPSGETSSYRSNPIRLSEFALSRRCPDYVAHSKKIRQADEAKRNNQQIPDDVLKVLTSFGSAPENTTIGSCIFAVKPGDGSAREQAASCQKVLGGFANICYEYATKRYRSNCINWGIVPFTIDKQTPFPYQNGDYIYIPDIRNAIMNDLAAIPAKVLTKDGQIHTLQLCLEGITSNEKQILLDGCLMNYYAASFAK